MSRSSTSRSNRPLPLKSPPGRCSHLYGFVFGHLSTRQQNAGHFETKRKQKLYPRAQHVDPLFGNLSEVLGVCLKFRSLPGIVVSNKCSNSADPCDCFLGMADDCRSSLDQLVSSTHPRAHTTYLWSPACQRCADSRWPS
jgi:hypothetical protein